MAVPDEDEDNHDAALDRDRIAEFLAFKRQLDTFKREAGKKSDSESSQQQGNGFYRLGLYSQAATMYSTAIDLSPSAVLYSNRAMAYLKQDMADEALADAERALELDPEMVKGHWRKAQALHDLGRFEDSDAAATEGLRREPGNRHLNSVRRKAREGRVTQRLVGDWVCRGHGGVEQRMRFEDNGAYTIFLMGQELLATFELSVEGQPWSMVVRMKDVGFGNGNGPPPPPVPYIFDFHGEELWLCCPVDGSKELPQKFEGPGHMRLRRAPKLPEPLTNQTGPMEERCRTYLREMTSVLPILPPQLPEEPSDLEIAREVRVTEELAALKRRHGNDVHRRALELAKAPEQAGDAELADLAEDLRRRLVSRKVLAPREAELAGDPPPAMGTGAAAATAAPDARRAAPPAGCLDGLAARLCCR